MIETQRLLLIPLSYSQLIKYLKNDGSLEQELNLNTTKWDISPELKEALEKTIIPNVAISGDKSLFSTLWTLVLKEQNTMVGDLCFMGEPNDEGEIEIGYGTYEGFRNNGYMGEAVGGIIYWVQEQPNVKSIIASTEKSNTASYSILKKNSFIKESETDTLYNWSLKVKH